MEIVVPLAVENALPSMPEDQSPTLMNEGVMGDVAPKLEPSEVREIEEEYRSCCTTERMTMKEMMLTMRTRLVMLLKNNLNIKS